MAVLLACPELHQCAWCRCLMVDGEKFEDCLEILDMSHGICLECLEKIEPSLKIRS
ncbi:MAG: hypothetical protein ABRQ37_19905 [Candidatus Eremiobacterota bacterium]